MRLLLCEDNLIPGAEMELSSPGAARFIYCHDGDCHVNAHYPGEDATISPTILSPGKAIFTNGVTHIQAGFTGAILIKWEFIPQDVAGETWSQGVASRLLCEQILTPISRDYSRVYLNLLLVDALENIVLGDKDDENIYLLLKGEGEIPSFANMNMGANVNATIDPASIQAGQAWAKAKGKKQGFTNKANQPAWLLELKISDDDNDDADNAGAPTVATQKFICHSLSEGAILYE